MPLIDKYVIPEGTYDNGNSLGTYQWHQMLAHIKQMSDERLITLFTNFYAPNGRYNYDLPEFKAVAEEVGPCNLTMLMLKLAEEAYMRQDDEGNDLLHEDEFSRLQDEG